VGELAYHWAQASRPGDSAKAVAYAGLAGSRALSTLAPAEAVRWYTQALDLLGDAATPDRDRAELLVGLGDAQRQVGIAAYRETLLEAAKVAERAHDPDLLARAALTNNRGWQSRIGDADHDRLAVLRSALDNMASENKATRARLLALFAAEQIYTAPLADRLSIAQDAIGLGRASGDAGALADTLIRAVQAVIAPSTLALRLGWLAEAVGAADTVDDPVQRFLTRHLLLRCELESANREGFETSLAITGSILDRLPHAGLRWTHAYDLAVQALLAGNLAEAERLATDALNYGIETAQPDAFTIYGSQLLNIRVRQGRLSELIPLIAQTVSQLPGQAVYQSVLAMAYADAGELDQARGLLDKASSAGLVVPEDNAWSSAHYCWADVAVRTSHSSSAAVLHRRLAPFSDQLVTTHVTIDPVLAHTIGRLEHVLGQLDAADASFRRAAELHARLRCPPFIALTEVAWADLLIDRDRDDDRTRARAMAERARGTASRHRYAGVESAAAAILDRLR
jgi:tetratricopeptide (TPR) repeat protein